MLGSVPRLVDGLFGTIWAIGVPGDCEIDEGDSVPVVCDLAEVADIVPGIVLEHPCHHGQKD